MLGVGLALLATVLWAGNFVLARGLSDAVPPVALNFWRWTVATALLAPFALRASVATRTAVRHHLGYLTVTAMLGVAVFNTLVYAAGHSTQALNLSLVAVCSPVVIVVLARLFLGERITRRAVLGLAVAGCGVVVLLSDGRPTRLLHLDVAPGDLIMLLATVVFGAYTVLVGRKPDDVPLTVFVFTTFALGLLMLAPAYGLELAVSGPFDLGGDTLAALAYIGVFPSLVAFYSWNRAVTTLGATRSATLYYLVPVFTALAAWAFLAEPISAAALLSTALVLAGVALSQTR